MGSGPGRALAGQEKLYSEIGYKDQCDSACLVLETHKAPPPEIIEKVARDTGVNPENLTFILTPTSSLAGSIQIVARVLEVALHKVHTLGFPLENVIDGIGAAPVAPPAKNFITAMGRTNDAILFCGQVQLFVQATDDEAKDLAEKMPSSTSRDYGKPFATTFKEHNYDFYTLDPMLFAPAHITVTAMDSGRSFSSGKPDKDLLHMSFS